MLKYIALFETDGKADGVGVVFPDIPGCVSAGENYEEAYKNAHEILSFFINDMKERGEKIPKPRTLEQIKAGWAEWKWWEKHASFVVGFVSCFSESKPKKYTIYMDSALMEQIDEVSSNRSAFLSEAAKGMLA